MAGPKGVGLTKWFNQKWVNIGAPKKKAETDKKFNAKPEQKAKRRELSKERTKRGIMGKGGKDLSHTKSGGLVKEDPSKNRARNRGKK